MKIISLMIVILINTLVFSTVNDWEKNKLKYKVKEVDFIQYDYHFANNKINKNITFHETTKYNIEGFIFEEYLYHGKSGKLMTKTSYLYDEENRVIKKEYYDIIRNFKSGYIYHYDNKNNLIEEKSFYNDSISYGFIYKYDEKNNLIEKTTYHYPENKISGKEIFDLKYNIKGKVIEKKSYVSDLKFTNLMFFEKYFYNGSDILEKYEFYDLLETPSRQFSKEISYYDKNGNIIQIDYYDLNNEFLYKQLRKYDYKNNIIIEYEKNKNNYEYNIHNYNYIYNKNGYLIQKISIFQNSKAKRVFKYDINNNLIEELQFNSAVNEDNEKLVQSYKYLLKYYD